MKKSEIYKTAQVAVLNSGFSSIDKLEIIRELMKEEDLALLCEKENNNGKSV